MSKKPEKALMTATDLFKESIEILAEIQHQVDGEGKRDLLKIAEHFHSLVEIHSANQQVVETALSNLEHALKQRNYALKVLALWQESGTEMATGAAAEMVAEVLTSETERADPRDVQMALNRLLGFDSGSVPQDALMQFFQAVDKVTRQVESEKTDKTDIA